MAKKIVQDIYVVKKSIRMVKKSDVSDGFFVDKKNKEEKKVSEEDLTEDLVNKLPVEEKTKESVCEELVEEKKHITKDSLIILWTICIVAVGTLLFFLSSAFAIATLTITPKNQTVALNDTYNITSDPTVASTTLHFEVMTIKEDLSKNLETDGEQYVEKKAVGKAVIYNNFSSADQRLINNTRLQTKDGSIYRIRSSVDVPGITTVKGVKTPGSVEVDIIADMPGDKYNMKLSDLKGDFTIPGFEGSTKFAGFYARLSSDLTGGYIGNVKKVSDATIQAARTEIQNTLKDGLIKEIYAKNTEQNILFKNNYYIQCTDLPDDSSGSEYKITEECSINAIIFNKNDLAAFIAQNKNANPDHSKVDIMWNDSDTVVLSGNTATPWNETSLTAVFTGPALIVWSYDTSGILNSIAGQDKSIINSVIKKNSNSLTEIKANIKPMWRNTFPENINKIKIIDTIRDSSK